MRQPNEPAPSPAEPSMKKVSPWVKGFVLFHLVAITSWTLPNAAPPVAAGRMPAQGLDPFLLWNSRNLKDSPIRLYLFSTGFWQFWDMFAPTPIRTDTWGDARVTFGDGQSEIYLFPRSSTSPIPQKILTERFRKFFERAHLEKNQALWPYLAGGVAKDVERTEGRKPVRVELRRYLRVVAGPDEVQQPATGPVTFFDSAKPEALEESAP